ncbi:MAG TPA: tRNA (N6-isopentenyl adenosine(37)-C2)-methylthiotransferase MiaB [Candidatus Omnitrophica bacterium]|nr:tRNA (N6-isopentenyl adenosine(37)-C2)-methylthiotransferase MiaB [Candidatus Omnitrophota bacterium]HBG62939.1 tRNA (N6-isopentenyl adenosine(37)-C2)-methylthiotransferase MiaB [Candidatus Omnitrophota bacterium]
MSKESKAYKNLPKKVYIRTFGCQMNLRDSEVIAGLLLEGGFGVTEEEEKADAVLFVTCSVRQHAEDKVWSEIGRFSKMVPKPVIGLVGCMAENYKDKAFKRMQGIDVVVGTNNIGEIPYLLKEVFAHQLISSLAHQPFLAVSKKERDEVVYESMFRQEKDSSFVVISEGCDNFCSYCVVPYVRGRLRHRNYKNIIAEIEQNIKQGIERVTLLGQNVNAYQFKSVSQYQEIRILPPPLPSPHQGRAYRSRSIVNFMQLLKLVNDIDGLREFSFVTSHPKDASVELFEAMAKLDKLKKYLHLPFQSGSNRILELMKRGYTRERYLQLAGEYRKIVPQGELTTDIIVGFPSETEEDFKETLELVQKVRFNGAYIFKYSPRPHAKAGELPDDVPKIEKERRHRILLETQKKISKELKAKQ